MRKFKSVNELVNTLKPDQPVYCIRKEEIKKSATQRGTERANQNGEREHAPIFSNLSTSWPGPTTI